MGKFCITLSTLLTLCTSAYAVSVNRVQVAPRRGVLIATVDLEKVFQAYPGTKKAKEDLERLVLMKENEIAVKRAEIFRLTEESAKLKSAPPVSFLPGFGEKTAAAGTTTLKELTTTAVPLAAPLRSASGTNGGPEAPAAPSVVPMPATDASVEALEAQLKTKKEELRQMEKHAEKNLEDLEQAKTKTLLAKIYFSLRELAEEKNVDMIVDKHAILWGSSRLDLTDDLMRKLKSAMIEAE